MKWRRALPIVAIALALAVLAVLYYRATTLTNLIPVGYDTFTYFFPNEFFGAQALSQGHLPLWNPELFAGVPFLANSQTALFYPPNLLFVMMDVPRAYVWSVALHVAIAGIAMYAFSRAVLNVDRCGAIVGASIVMFAGFTGGLYGHLNQLHVFAWAPLVLLFFHHAYRRENTRWALAAGVVICLQALAGHTQELYLTLIVLGFFWIMLLLADIVARKKVEPRSEPAGRVNQEMTVQPVAGSATAASKAPPANTSLYMTLPPKAFAVVAGRVTPTMAYYLRQIGRFAIVVGAGFGLAAVQLIPTLELSGLSLRAGGMTFDEASSFSLPPWLLLKALLPAYGQPAIFSEWLGYVGVAGLLLAALAIACRYRQRYVIFFTLLAVLSLLLALGEATPLYKLVYTIVPGTKLFRVPARWLYPYSLSLAALAAIGLNALMASAEWRSKARVVIRFVILIAIVAALFLAYRLLRLQPAMELPNLTTVLVWVATAVVTVGLFGLALRPRWRTFAAGGIAAVVLVELFVAGLGLDLNRPNLPESFASSRPAAAFFATDAGLYRTLASSDNTFDPGDMAEMKAMLAPVLANDRIYDYIVAAKHKETLTPNLTMVYGIQSLDGYDGGVLPLKRYAEFKSIFQLRKAEADAERFREQLVAVPSTQLLSWLNVKYVLMDRVHDVWTDGVYYDLSVEQRLANGQDLTLDHLKSFDSTAIGIISALENGASIPQGTDVATVTISDADGTSYSTTLKAGVATAEGQFEQSAPAHQQARAVAHPKGEDKTDLYLAKLTLPATGHPKSITIHATAPSGQLRVRGLSMIDDRLGLSEPVPVDNNLRLAYLGDVKIYENRAVMPRAFLVNKLSLVGSDQEALDTLKADAFQPSQTAVVLSKDWQKAYPNTASELGNAGTNSSTAGEVKIDSYAAEKVTLSTASAQRSFLVLTDSYYPGWHVKVDGQEQPILPTNYLFRGVVLEAGQHKVEFSYAPDSLRQGILISVVALLVVIVIADASWRGKREVPLITVPPVTPDDQKQDS